MKKDSLAHNQKEWAYARWCEGRTLLEIAMALNVCDRTIRRAINGRPRNKPVLVYRED